MQNYYMWRAQGENYVVGNFTPGSSSTADHGSTSRHVEVNMNTDNRYVEIVQDAFNDHHHDYSAYNHYDSGAYKKYDSCAMIINMISVHIFIMSISRKNQIQSRKSFMIC